MHEYTSMVWQPFLQGRQLQPISVSASLVHVVEFFIQQHYLILWKGRQVCLCQGSFICEWMKANPFWADFCPTFTNKT